MAFIMEKSLSDNSVYWESFYARYRFPSMKELGFSNVKRAELEIVGQPTILNGLRELINDFWAEYSAATPGAKRNPKYGVTGTESIEYVDGVLKVRAFQMDYATTVFSSDRRGEHYTYLLTESERNFLQNKLATLGVIGITQNHSGNYLIGTKAGTRITGGLKEPLPMGMIDPHKTPNGFDPFMSGLLNELNEETGLYLRDVEEIKPTHFSIGMSYGDFALISDVKLRPGAEEHVKISQEHTDATFMAPDEIRSLSRYVMNPVLVGSLTAKGVYE
ncbi:hypothetical protein HYX13_04880 [Candidatus Woesearchaeota archaeon]|nr:hypothetical protein [Candidatus Woesearchaeota archaeon]